MIGNYFARLTGSKRNLLALLASSFVFTSGCANMTSTAPMSNSLSSPATLSGKIHGGNQPVSGATVTLWYAGQSGVATQAATTTSDSTGSFSFVKDPTNGNTDSGNEYSCPSNTDPVVYVVSKGGNTQNNGIPSQTNTAAAFIAIYGTCSLLNANNFVFMSEVTTAATMAAAVQFFNPSLETLTADGTGQQKFIVNGIPNTVALLANLTTGMANSSKVLTTASSIGHAVNINPAVTTTATPEASKLNLIANIISACVNSATASSTPCTSLFAAAAPPPAVNVTNFNAAIPTPTDTLQVLYDLFTNPTSNTSTAGTGGTANIATLFGLAGGVGAPYQPSLAAAPTDWTLGITYTASGSCGTSSGGSGAFISSPTDIAIDAFNNVWIANSATGGNLSEIAQSGAPATCVNLDAGAGASLAIDAMQSVWFGAGTTMYRYSPGGFTNLPAQPAGTLAFPVGVSPLGVTADGVNNVYFSSVAGTTGSLNLLSGAATASAAVTPTLISTTVGPNPIRLMPDFIASATQGNIWVTSGSTFVSQVMPTATTPNTGGFVTNPFPISGGNAYGLSLTHGNSVYVSALDTGAISKLVSPSYGPAGNWPFTAASSAGINTPTALALDGRSNTWIPNNGNGSGTGSVSEISNSPNPLSPSIGFQKDSTFLHSNRTLAVDQAGNVWVVGDGNNFVTEFVGSGVPIYQPYAVGLKNGRFQTIP